MKRSKGPRFKTWVVNGLLAVSALAFASFLFAGCSTMPETKTEPAAAPSIAPARHERQGAMDEAWGIEIEGMRLSAGGYMLDFRYRVLDPDKAYPVVDPGKTPYLIDQATGARFIVPAPAKVGSLRQTANNGKLIAGRTYFIIFSNPGRFVKAGDKVTVEIGDFRAENLVVE